MKRRALLLSGLGAAGALTVGWGWLVPRSRVGSAAGFSLPAGDIGLNGWIAIGPDGAVRLAMPRSEMGQGVHTALAMLAAEELEVPLERVLPVPVTGHRLYGNVAALVSALPAHPRDGGADQPALLLGAGRWLLGRVATDLGLQITGGSTSVADAWEPLRHAAALARGQLLGAASLQWRLPVAELGVADGVVSHPSGPRAHYGELARAAALTPPGDAAPKPPSQWRLIGRPAPRIDLPAKTDGSARFGLDVRLPDQVFAAVRHCPMIGGAPGAVDVGPAMRLPGVERVVRLGPAAGSTAALAVVGLTTWHAERGARALQVEWRQRPAGAVDSAAAMASLDAAARQAALGGQGTVFYSRGDAPAVWARSARRVEAVYRAPFLAHAAMEPVNCTARVADGRVELWVPTQAPGAARQLAARIANVPEDAVTVNVTYLGGGFGRRLEIDAVGQAVRVAMETGGRPVQLVWSREEDFGHDYYRPAAVAVLQAGLDRQGRPVVLQVASAGDAITPRNIERTLPAMAGRFDLPDKTTAEGLFDLPYAIEHQRMAHVATRHAVPVGFWRSVGHSHNAFFSESFMDELAHAAGADPLAYRLELLKDMPRHAAVLRLAAERAGWGAPLAKGRTRGLALHESFGSIVAQVVEVSLAGGLPKVHRVVCAVDCGIAVNPGIVAQQMESGIVFGLSAALYGRIDIEGGVVRQKNFPDQPLLTLAQTPAIETHLVPSSQAPGGVGEPGVPPVAPALANALFALTGQRLRELPLRPA